MNIPTLALASLLAIPAALAENMATAEWIPETAAITPGQPFRTIVRLEIDKGWHTYWENPGEGGLPLSVEVELPDGWTLGEIQFPAPIAFTTGALHGYGYEREVHLPLTITPPAGSNATEFPAGITPAISWLTCNDQSCVPGKANPTLSPPQPEIVEKAYAALPEEIPAATLATSIEGENVTLTLTLPANIKLDPTTCTVFPATRNVLTPSAKPTFGKHDSSPDTWTTTAPKSEYLEGTPKTLTLVLVDAAGKAWTVSTK